METTAKEKEYAFSIGYILIAILVILLSSRVVINLLSGVNLPLLVTNLQIVTQKYPIILDKSFIYSTSLLLVAFINMTTDTRLRVNVSVKKAKGLIVVSCALFAVGYFLIPSEGNMLYIETLVLTIGCFLFIRGGVLLNSQVTGPSRDIFNKSNQQFPQNQEDLRVDGSVTFATQFVYGDKYHEGIVPVINPYRAVMVVGSQGSGKTFSILVPALWQSIANGTTCLVYDFKYPDMALEAANALKFALSLNKYAFGKTEDGSPILPSFNVISFDNPKERCNPFGLEYMPTIEDCSEMCKTLLFNLNKSWIKKEGDFWATSAVNLLTTVMWMLRLMEEDNEGNELYRDICNLPMAIEMLTNDPEKLFKIIAGFPSLSAYSSMFIHALNNQAGNQIAGQIASTQAALAPLSTPNLYYCMTGNDFSLDINDPKNPQITILANNPIKSKTYGAALSVYTAVIMKRIYKYKKIKAALFIDELPTMYLQGLDDFIATVRSYKVATWMGLQDYEQLTKSYGKEAADVIINTAGSVFVGQVSGSTADRVSKMFGENVQESIGTSVNKKDANVSYSQNLKAMIPASEIATLPQGNFVGKVADEFGTELKLKRFNGFFNVPTDQMKKSIKELPSKDLTPDIKANYAKVKLDAKLIFEDYSGRL